MSSVKNIMLAGANGNLGASLLKALLAEPSFTVTILSRVDSTATFPTGVPVVRTDYTLASLTSAFRGQDVVIAAVASASIPIQTVMIDAAIAAGTVKRFIPGEFGSDTTNPQTARRVPLLAAKGEVLRYLREREDRISWTAMITGPFFDWGMRVGLYGFDLENRSATLYEEGHASTFSTSTLPDIGAALVRVLLAPNYNRSANRPVFVRSLTTSQDQILDALRSVDPEAHRSSWRVETVKLAPRIAEAEDKAKKGDYSGFVPMILGLFFDPEAGTDIDKRGIVENRDLGLRDDRTVEECVRELF